MVELPNPGPPGQPGRSRDQAVQRTGGGRVLAEDRSDGAFSTPSLEMDLSEDEYAGLMAFFYDVAQGSANAFTYTDENGAVSEVRFLPENGSLGARHIEYNHWEVLIGLAFLPN